MNEQTLDLRDIHLPEPISWWPLAPGWWLLFAAIILIIVFAYILRKIYLGKQLKREIAAELENIKKYFSETGNRSQLAKSLSVLLRRASITYYPATNIAGLTGEHWLAYLDKSNQHPAGSKKFQSDTGRILLTAPYLPDNASLDFDANELIQLCESWLLSTHKNTRRVKTS